MGGGWQYIATGKVSTIGGGQYNTALGPAATVGGGWRNRAEGAGSTVPGGRDNTAQGDYSLAAGRKATARHAGAFVWSDAGETEFSSTGDNQFLVQAEGNVGIDTDQPAEKLTVEGNIAPATGGRHTLGTEPLRWARIFTDGVLDYDTVLVAEANGTTNLTLDSNGNLVVRGTITSEGIQVSEGPSAAGAGAAPRVEENPPPFSAGQADVLRVYGNDLSPNIVEGHASNEVVAASAGVVISGGGQGDTPNRAENGMGIGTAETPEKLTVAGNVAPAEAAAFDLGSETLTWRQLHLDGSIQVPSNLLIQSGGTTLMEIDQGGIRIKGTLKADGLDVAGFVPGGGEPGMGPTAASLAVTVREVLAEEGPALIRTSALAKDTLFRGAITGPWSNLVLGRIL